METITLDFEFGKYSRQYGTFLHLCYDFPDVEVVNATKFHWNWYKADYLLVGVDAPPELAMILKLQFSDYLKRRPSAAELKALQDEARAEAEKQKEIENNTKLIYNKIRSNRYWGKENYIEEEWFSKKLILEDYAKNRTLQDVATMYEQLKQYIKG